MLYELRQFHVFAFFVMLPIILFFCYSMPFGPVNIYVHLRFSIITLNNFVATAADTLLPTDVYYTQAPALQVSANQTTLENPFLIVYTNSVLDIEAQALNVAAALQTQTPKLDPSPINNLVLDATMHATNFDTRGFFLQPVRLHNAWSRNTQYGLRRNPLESYDYRSRLEFYDEFYAELEQIKMMEAGLFNAGDSGGYRAYGGESSPIGAEGLDFNNVADPYGSLDGEAALELLDTLRHSLEIFKRVHTTDELLLCGICGNSSTDNVTYNACPEYSGFDETMDLIGLETDSGKDNYDYIVYMVDIEEPGMEEVAAGCMALASMQREDCPFLSWEVLLLTFVFALCDGGLPYLEYLE